MASEREGAVVMKGHTEGMKQAGALLKEFGLPEGLLPLENVVEVGYVKKTGYMWIAQKKEVEHTFKLISKQVSYDTDIHGYIEVGRIKKLKGVKAKELLIWASVSDIILETPLTGKIQFKSFAGITKTFPVEAFAAGQ
ncbi:hypothetical protein SUGI_0787770 [Cryptomeria japonica]|uniref:uncharacterized protein LOC131028916 n=1 Tax=Cryptomeria japonica TaxID=3369 RepID=UPI002414909D|nr:uncharacterized protein LOC131028916 [Cryptomeria japonica]GLJ38639.1 hypothetical protein SUGI_0787770 [Cryptomeria japonica]